MDSNINNIIRELKIDHIIGNYNDVLIWVEHLQNTTKKLECNVFHDNGGEIIYYIDDKNWILYFDEKSDVIWCNDLNFWNKLESMFTDLIYYDILELSEYLIELAFDISIKCPIKSISLVDESIENIIKQKHNDSK